MSTGLEKNHQVADGLVEHLMKRMKRAANLAATRKEKTLQKEEGGRCGVLDFNNSTSLHITKCNRTH